MNNRNDSVDCFNVAQGCIDVPGGRVGYKIFTDRTDGIVSASPARPPILMLHGGPGGVHQYFDVLKPLAQRCSVIAYDQLGAGLSYTPPGNQHLWNLDRFVDELECVVDGLNLKLFYLLGHSWGGVLAAEYALKHPEKLCGLIFSSPLLNTSLWIQDAHRLLKQLPPVVQAMIRQHESEGTTNSEEYKAAARQYYNRFVCRQTPWPKLLAEVAGRVNSEVYHTMWGPSEFNVTGNLIDYDCVERLHALSMPVLFTCGRYDEATPETLEKISRIIKDSRLVVFEQSAHLPFLEETKLYLQTLTKFIELC